MKRYVIERDIPGIGAMSAEELSQAAQTSNAALEKLAPKIQWQHSYVTADKTFCVYLAQDQDVIRKHAEISGFPANVVTEVTGMIDRTTGA
jgi:hypothetical protein